MGNVSLKLTKVFQRIYYYDSIKSEKKKDSHLNAIIPNLICNYFYRPFVTNIRCLSINKGPILFLCRFCRLDIFSC